MSPLSNIKISLLQKRTNPFLNYLHRPLQMASTTSTVSLISSTTSSSTFPLKFNFPAKSPSTVNFRANPLTAANAASSGKDRVLGEEDWYLHLQPHCPLLLPFSECIEAFAARRSDLSEYELVKEEIRKVVTKGKAAGVLRLVFHDAGTFQVDENSETQELVALSGAHTIGNKGFGSPTVFDNTYFKILLEKPSSGSMIGLPSDRALAKDDECLRWITKYAEDQDVFFEDFKKAYVKLVNSGARWKSL
ncbi:hypothetical protein GBA52_001058 [Prunus armeniaca]|nr:hypothetical protein GBA52_001058 [Prunus armeniaca]